MSISSSSTTTGGAVVCVFDSIDLLTTIFDFLSISTLFGCSSTCSDWYGVIHGSKHHPTTTSSNRVHRDNNSSRETMLARYALPDARRPDIRAMGGALATIAAEPIAAAETTPKATPTAGPISTDDPDRDLPSPDSPPLSYLHHRTVLDLSRCPSSLVACQSLMRALHHPDSKLRRIILRGPAERMATGEIIGQLHTRTLGALEELSTCDCLVGEVLSSSHSGGLYPTLKRWSETPLDYTPEHASLHQIRIDLPILLPQLTSLTCLNLADAKVWDDTLFIIGETLFKTLRMINLNFNIDITNVGLNALDRCYQLQELQLQRCWKLTADGVGRFFQSIALGWTTVVAIDGQLDAPISCDLRFLNLTEIRDRGGLLLDSLTSYCPKLCHLEVGEINLTLEQLQHLIERCTKLRCVNFGKLGSIAALRTNLTPGATHAQRGEMTPHAPAMAGAGAGAGTFVRPVALPPVETRLTDDGLAHISRWSDLEQLRLDDAPITNRGMTYLSPKYLPHLSHLSLWGCTQLGDEGIQHLFEEATVDDDGDTSSLDGSSSMTRLCRNMTLRFLLLPLNIRTLTSRTIELLTYGAPNLEHLVGHVPCTNIHTLTRICDNLKRLKSLSLSSEGGGPNGGGAGGGARMPTFGSIGTTNPSSSSSSSPSIPVDSLNTFGVRSSIPSKRLDSASLRRLTELRELECLDLRCSVLRDSDLLHIMTTLTYLRVLKLSKCHITDDAFNWSKIQTVSSSSSSCSPPPLPSASSSSHSVRSLYFDPTTVGWSSTRLELVYLAHLPSISSRTLESIGQLSSVRYIDVVQCEMIQHEQMRIETIQERWNQERAQGKRLPITCLIHT